MDAFDDCTAQVDAQQGAKVAADMHAKEVSKQKFKDAEREKGGACKGHGSLRPPLRPGAD